MSSWTGTRVPAKTGVPLKMSGDDVTIGCAIGLNLLPVDRAAQGAELRGDVVGRQRDNDATPALVSTDGRRGLHDDVPAVHFRDAPGERQPQAYATCAVRGARPVAAVERREDAFALSGRDTRPLV